MENEYESNLPDVVKKLNIFQKMRIVLFLRNLRKEYLNFDFEKYSQAPEYIKRDNKVVDELINIIIRSEINPNEMVQVSHADSYVDYGAFSFSEEKEANLLRIPEDVLVEKIRETVYLADILSDEKQLEIAQKNPNIWSWLHGNQLKLMHKALRMGKYDFVEVFPDVQETILKEMAQEGTLEEELPKLINYLERTDKIIQEKPDLLIYLDREKQRKYIEKDKENFLRYASGDEQLNYIEGYKEGFEFASELVMSKYVEMHKDELEKEDSSFQYKILQNYPLAYEYVSDKVKDEIWSNPKNPESLKSAIALLDSDTNYSKKIMEYGFNIVDVDGDKIYGFRNSLRTRISPLFERV